MMYLAHVVLWRNAFVCTFICCELCYIDSIFALLGIVWPKKRLGWTPIILTYLVIIIASATHVVICSIHTKTACLSLWLYYYNITFLYTVIKSLELCKIWFSKLLSVKLYSAVSCRMTKYHIHVCEIGKCSNQACKNEECGIVICKMENPKTSICKREYANLRTLLFNVNKR